MKKVLLSVLVIASAQFSVVAHADALLEKVQKLAQSQLDKDIKRHVYRVEGGICGASGPSYVVELQVQHFKKVMNEDGNRTLKSEWRVEKTYGIPASEVNSSDAQLQDQEACLE